MTPEEMADRAADLAQAADRSQDIELGNHYALMSLAYSQAVAASAHVLAVRLARDEAVAEIQRRTGGAT
ncbi:hypothetical protein BBK14_11095 [Parafrankia soli]|uniref:Uncharacterized protein n=1 Tax=Parafrankia soli TaxID=2599596 RepID=A0A1S1R7L2_9ACTN|nr:hypothetical protein [Parafrankia soli]OHV42160.1 hypothetical protein BBK14_11095 [Parafrankia soli]